MIQAVRAVPGAIERGFLPLAVGMSVAALFVPGLFLWIKPHISLGLGIIMFGMGLTLELRDFAAVLPRWPLVLLGVVLQYCVMPLLAVAANFAFGLPVEVAVGLVVVGSCPGGTASNVIAYLAKANVALSVVMTLVSTALAPIVTPALVYLLCAKSIQVDFWAMVESVFWIVVFPLVDGLVLRRLLRERVRPMIRIFPSISILAISAIIACVVALNRETILAFPLAVMAAVVCVNVTGFTLGYWIPVLAGVPAREARTVAIEVGMQNSGLGVALSYAYFSAQAALPGALFSLEQNLVGVILARRWSRKRD